MAHVYTLGYAAKGADETLSALVSNPFVVLLDIRLSPRSRFYPAFGKSALESRFEESYFHLPELGNLNYRDHALPIVLADPAKGLPVVEFWLKQGYSVCLLCACARVESCHRRVVADLLVQQGYAVVHL